MIEPLIHGVFTKSAELASELNYRILGMKELVLEHTVLAHFSFTNDVEVIAVSLSMFSFHLSPPISRGWPDSTGHGKST